MLNEVLKFVRIHYGVSISDLSRRIGFSEEKIINIESGEGEISYDFIKRYCDAFDLPINGIIFFSDEKQNKGNLSFLRKIAAKFFLFFLKFNQK